MRNIRQILRWISSIALLALLVMPAISCIDIYLSARDAVPLEQMYSPDDIQARLQFMALPYAILAGVPCIVSVLLKVLPGKKAQQGYMQMASRSSAMLQDKAGRMKSGRSIGHQRLILLVTAAAFIALGVVNGGWYDVLVKAINICTECIGLG